MIAARQKAGPIAGLVLSLVFTFMLVWTATIDLIISGSLVSADGIPATGIPFSIRLPSVGLYSDTITGGATYKFVRVQYPRGTKLSTAEKNLVEAYENQRRPPSAALVAGLGAAFFLILLLYTSHLRVMAITAFFRTQMVLLLSLLLLAIAAKAYLAVTAFSAMWIPLGVLVIPCAAHLGARAAGGTAIAGSMILGLLTPIDLPLLAVLSAQGLAASVVAGRKGKNGSPVLSGLAAALAAGIGYAAISLLLQQYVPSLDQLREPRLWLHSDLAGSIGGGLLGGLLSVVTLPVAGRMLGVVSKPRLLDLANFESPLLRQIATKTPGTWAHSLAMANMAEMAANAIGADALLVRVGAYYHDLGKTVQPEYFIENQQGQNPHDTLAPDVSADAIFAHITEGVKLARKHKLPEAVEEFIYTHHGDGVLEYFWHKNMQQGNPKNLDEREFRYPGCRPQRPEAAILAICDAVEAASRTLKEPDLDKVKQLVRQIIFTKLEQGALNDSGLTLEAIERIINSIVETLKSNLHVRVKYPWQRDEETARPAQRGDPTGAPAPAGLPAIMAAAPSERPSDVIPLQRTKTGQRREDPSISKIPDPRERNRVMTMPLASRGPQDPKIPSGPEDK